MGQQGYRLADFLVTGTRKVSGSRSTLQYFQEDDSLDILFHETYRALTPGGRFHIWDALVPPRSRDDRDVAVFVDSVVLEEETVEAGYGMHWSLAGRSAKGYTGMACKVGFELRRQTEAGHSLHLELVRPGA